MALSFSVGIYQTAPVAEVIRLTRLAEDLGFEAAWLGDSQCLWREAFVTLGALAASTSRIRLGLSVTNPVTRHLTVTASGILSVAELTDGRALLGIGRGETSVVLVGEKRATLAELAAAVPALRALCAGQSVRLGGVETRLAYAESAHRTIPIYLPGLGPKMLRLAGELADGVLLTVGADPRYIRSGLEAIEDGARSAGRLRGTVRVAARIPCSISDEADARRDVRSHVALAVLQNNKPFAFDQEDLPAIERIRQTYDYQRHLTPDAMHANLVPDALVDKFALAGPPEECLERVRAIAACGVEELNVVLMSPTPERLLRTFASRIMERL